MLFNIFRSMALVIVCGMNIGCAYFYTSDKCNPNLKQGEKRPLWVHTEEVPTGCEGIIVCSYNAYSYQQIDEATGIALHSLKLNQGTEVNSELDIHIGDINTKTDIYTSQKSKGIVKAQLYAKWKAKSGNKSCVWLKLVK